MKMIPHMAKLIKILSENATPQLDWTSLWIVAHEGVALPRSDETTQTTILIGKSHKASFATSKGVIDDHAQMVTYDGPQGKLKGKSTTPPWALIM